jgi:predicted membrane channel-forming protein YqfA (hemolysin III family)
MEKPKKKLYDIWCHVVGFVTCLYLLIYLFVLMAV